MGYGAVKSLKKGKSQNLTRPENQPDKRLKTIEIVILLGGFLGVIIALQQDVLPAQAKPLFSVLIVLFIVFAFFAYSAISIPMDEKSIRKFLGAFSVTFSGLLALVISIPTITALAPLLIQSFPYIGVLGAVVVYLAIASVLVFVFYYLLSRAILLTFGKMEPKQANEPEKARDKPLKGNKPSIFQTFILRALILFVIMGGLFSGFVILVFDSLGASFSQVDFIAVSIAFMSLTLAIGITILSEESMDSLNEKLDKLIEMVGKLQKAGATADERG